MVKGWEARAELANKRREEARLRKQERKGPKKITGDTENSMKSIDFMMCSNSSYVYRRGRADCCHIS